MGWLLLYLAIGVFLTIRRENIGRDLVGISALPKQGIFFLINVLIWPIPLLIDMLRHNKRS